MAQDYLSTAGPMPDPKTLAWFAWKDTVYAAIRAYCTPARGTTYYFSQSGADGNNGLTPGTAKKTIAEAINVIAASAGNITLLFNRGDEWNETTMLALNKANIEIGSYGSGNLPWFNRFSKKYNASGWTLAAGNSYTRAEASDIAWVRFAGYDNSLSVAATQSGTNPCVLSRQTSSANCDATSFSFFWSGGTLRINLGGTNPNTVNLEANVTSTNPGIVVSVDKCYIHDLRIDGFGQDFSNPHNPQAYQIQWAQGTGEVGYAFNCVTTYGGTHLHASFQGAGSGNITLVEKCQAGFAMQGSAGETVFNSYSSLGNQEFYLLNCTMLSCTLPNGTATWVTRGISFYGHTAGAQTIGMIINDGLVVNNSAFGTARLSYLENTPVAATLSAVRAFHVREQHTGTAFTSFPYTNNAWINCDYVLTPVEMGGQSMFASGSSAQKFDGYMINNVVSLDLSGQTTTNSRSYYNPLSTDNNCNIWHNSFSFVPAATTAFRFDLDTGGASSSPNCRFFNNIYESSVGAIVSVGLENNSANLKNNAYFNIVGGADNVTRTAYGNDAGKVALAALISPVNKTTTKSLKRLGYTGIGLEYDKNLKRRPTLPEIGPFESGGILPNFRTNIRDWRNPA